MIEEKDFLVPTKGGFFEWIGYGLRFSVSEDSLPDGMEECRVNIKASLSGPFQLPEDCDLLSPIFWISAPCNSKKPVKLDIQHCASRDDKSFSDLKFISAKCSEKYLPYTFRQLDGGVFSTDSSYGSIQMSHFCGIGVAGRKKTPRSYCGQVYTIKKKASDWRVYFIVTVNLDIHGTVSDGIYIMTINSFVIPHFPYNAIQCPASVPLQLIREHHGHPAMPVSRLKIKFEEDRLTLDIPGDGTKTEEGWTITPFTHPTVSGLCYVDTSIIVK